jgi:hypothetical protein
MPVYGRRRKAGNVAKGDSPRIADVGRESP